MQELPASLQLASRAPLRLHRVELHELQPIAQRLPFLQLRARSEHSSDADRMSEASNADPPVLVFRLRQAASAAARLHAPSEARSSQSAVYGSFQRTWSFASVN